MEVDLDPEPLSFSRRIWYFTPKQIEVKHKTFILVFRIEGGYLTLFSRIYNSTGYSLPQRVKRIIFSETFDLEINHDKYNGRHLTEKDLDNFKEEFQNCYTLFAKSSATLLNSGLLFKNKTSTYQCSSPESLIYTRDENGSYFITLTDCDNQSLQYIYPHESKTISQNDSKRRIVTILPTIIGQDNKFCEQFRPFIENLQLDGPGGYNMWLIFDPLLLAALLITFQSDAKIVVYTTIFDAFLRGVIIKKEESQLVFNAYNELCEYVDFGSFYSAVNKDNFKIIIESEYEDKAWSLSWEKETTSPFSEMYEKSLKGVIREVKKGSWQKETSEGLIARLSKFKAALLLRSLPRMDFQKVQTDFLASKSDLFIQSWRVNESILVKGFSPLRTYHYIQAGIEKLFIVYGKVEYLKTIKFFKVDERRPSEVELIGVIKQDLHLSKCASGDYVITKYDSGMTLKDLLTERSSIVPQDYDLYEILIDINSTRY